MLKRFPLLLLLLLSLSLSAWAQNLEQPVGYLSAIGQEYQAMNKDMWRYISAVAHGKRAKKIENLRKDLLATIKESQSRVRKLPAFQKDPSLRDSVAAYFALSYKVINEDYAKIVDMEEIAEQSYDLMEAYMLAKELANRKLDGAAERVNEQQRLFAQQHGVQLVEGQSKLGAKLERAGSVFEYYNRHYLIFFKTYKQEAYLMAALEKGDIGALEQNRTTLLKYADEGLSKLDTLPRYKSDLTLKQANLQMQNFYRREAEMVSKWVEFLLIKEKFEQLNKAMEAKRPADRTKEDVDQYNAAVKEYNAAIAQFNGSLDQLNKSRSQQLDQWTKTVDAFLAKHVAK
ncbi:LIC11966 family surface protein [Cesiribacter andamanensis]|uniref:Uncharacterized protein n=1 Tax=Cesiribacter andamanensis AMV16 TaxID=1279009 RepID=M7NP05_9BACT|nr:hypothetical protein [Cesiribacter andamanensis]EMR03455.1 hypothetical protein ADICEAN_01388 [Cesiribacter andamanensis AMV16]